MTDPYIILPGSIILLSIGAAVGRITSGAAKLRVLLDMANIERREWRRAFIRTEIRYTKLKSGRARSNAALKAANAKRSEEAAAKRHKRIKASEDKFSLTPLAGHEIAV